MSHRRSLLFKKPTQEAGLYSAAQYIFSLRLANSNYSGDCIRVRRSSDNTEQDIGFSSGVLDTSALTTFVGANDGYITIWYNQTTVSGYTGYDFYNDTGSNEPQIVSGGTVITDNGTTAMTISSSAYLLNDNFEISDVDISAFVVTQLNASNKSIIQGVTATAYYYFRRRLTTGQVWFRQGLSAVEYNPSISASTQMSLAFFYDSSTNDSDLTYNGTPLTGLTLSTNITALTDFKIDSINAKTQELIYFRSNQSANESAILTEQNDFYSIY